MKKSIITLICVFAFSALFGNETVHLISTAATSLLAAVVVDNTITRVQKEIAEHHQQIERTAQ